MDNAHPKTPVMGNVIAYQDRIKELHGELAAIRNKVTAAVAGGVPTGWLRALREIEEITERSL